MNIIISKQEIMNDFDYDLFCKKLGSKIDIDQNEFTISLEDAMAAGIIKNQNLKFQTIYNGAIYSDSYDNFEDALYDMNLMCEKEGADKRRVSIEVQIDRDYNRQKGFTDDRITMKELSREYLEGEQKAIVEKNEQKPIQKVEENSNTKVLDNPTFTKKEIHSEPPVVDEKKEYLDKYLVQIRESINQNIKYPQKAKKLSIEGIVIVKFKITESGIVEDILIIDGHKFLQNSTIEAIVEASKSFPKINKSIEIQIPIEYKLI